MTKTDTTFNRSIGELVRAEKDSVHNKAESNLFESIQIGNKLQLTIVESYFRGMVGETICAYSYFLINYELPLPTITPINTEEELRELYKIVTGRSNRLKVWYFIKNFRGWSEDPTPYVI